MTGQDVHSANFADFCDALGYGGGRESGFKIHSEVPLATEKISNIFYPDEPIHPAPAILGMYYYYNARDNTGFYNDGRLADGNAWTPHSHQPAI
jgi:hypothetical protein